MVFMNIKEFILVLISVVVICASYIIINRTQVFVEPITPESGYRYIHKIDRITGTRTSFYCTVSGDVSNPQSTCKQVFRTK